nr:hypothetical protein [Candidatus Sigynarchaeum springense]
MARTTLDQETVGERLVSWFFDDNDRPFTIIYDISNVLGDFFREHDGKQAGFRVLSIDAAPSPAELVDREQVVNDFDEGSGWYRHKWIIHVHGKHAPDVEKTATFYYYNHIGEGFQIANILDLLVKVDAIKSQGSIPLFDENPGMNRAAIKFLLDIPLPAIATDSGEFREPLAWLVSITCDTGLNPSAIADSPAWTEIANARVPCTHEVVLLDFVYRVNPANPCHLDERGASTVNRFLKVLLDTWNIKDVPLAEDWFENLSRVIRFVFLNGKPPASQRPQEPRRGGSTLDAFIAPAPRLDAPDTLPEATLQPLRALLADWTGSDDGTLVQRFKHWAFLARKQQPSPAIDAVTMQDVAASAFAFTGTVDIALARHLIEQQRSEKRDAATWAELVDGVIKKREKLWKKAARSWWSQRGLFFTPFGVHDMTMERFWQLVKDMGTFLSLTIPPGATWERVSALAWDSEKLHLSMIDPIFKYIFDKEDCFAPFLAIMKRIDDAYQELDKQFNALFTAHFSRAIKKNEYKKAACIQETIWKTSIDAIDRDNPIAFVFCDALRKDLAADVMAALGQLFDDNKAGIIDGSVKVDPVDVEGIVPSITNLGWSRVLQHESTIKVRLSGDDLISGIDEGSETKFLNDPKARESRIANIFTSNGKHVLVHHVDPANLEEGLDAYREKRDREDRPAIAVAWYEKFDDHDFTVEKLANERAALVAEVAKLVFKMHESGIKTVHVLVDHGFMFTENARVLDKIPDGKLHKRHCISPHVFPDNERARYADWTIIPVDDLPFIPESSSPDISSILLPKENRLFKKARADGLFYIHGGLSFQECDLRHFTSHCEFKPAVGIEYFEPHEHESIEIGGQKRYYLKEMGSSKYLQLQLQIKKKRGDEQLRPLTFKVTCDDSRVTIDNNKEMTVQSGATRNFKLSFDKNVHLQELTVCIKTPDNEVMKKVVVRVEEPSIYGPGELF